MAMKPSSCKRIPSKTQIAIHYSSKLSKTLQVDCLLHPHVLTAPDATSSPVHWALCWADRQTKPQLPPADTPNTNKQQSVHSTKHTSLAASPRASTLQQASFSHPDPTHSSATLPTSSLPPAGLPPCCKYLSSPLISHPYPSPPRKPLTSCDAPLRTPPHLKCQPPRSQSVPPTQP